MFMRLRAGVRLCGQRVNSCYQGSLRLREWRKSPYTSASPLRHPADVQLLQGHSSTDSKSPSRSDVVLLVLMPHRCHTAVRFCLLTSCFILKWNSPLAFPWCVTSLIPDGFHLIPIALMRVSSCPEPECFIPSCITAKPGSFCLLQSEFFVCFCDLNVNLL